MKKGQVAVIGFIVVIVLLVVIISLFYNQFLSIFSKESIYADVKKDSEHVASVLISEGYPANWDIGTVKKVGILEGDTISLDKLEKFSYIDYQKTKLLLGIKYDYMFFIENESGIIPLPNNYGFLGWNGYLYDGNGAGNFEDFFGVVKTRAEHISKQEKFVSLVDESGGTSFVKLVVYAWSTVDLKLDTTECSDGINNDGEEDSLIDLDDPGCDSLFDPEENDPSFNKTGFECRLSTQVCYHNNETEVLSLTQPFNIPTLSAGDFHSALVGQLYGQSYTRVCCYYQNYIATNCDQAGSITLLYLDKEKNAHVEQGNLGNYLEKVCLYGPYKNIQCRCSSSCAADETCMFSLSDYANAHIKACNAYANDINICCKFTDGEAAFVCGEIAGIDDDYVIDVFTTEDSYTVGDTIEVTGG